MNKSLLSGVIGGLITFCLLSAPGWLIFLALWFAVGYLTFKVGKNIDNIQDNEVVVFTLMGLFSFIIGLCLFKTKFLNEFWSLFTDSPPPKFRSPIYFDK